MKDNFMTTIEEGEEEEAYCQNTDIKETDDVKQRPFDYSFAGIKVIQFGCWRLIK